MPMIRKIAYFFLGFIFLIVVCYALVIGFTQYEFARLYRMADSVSVGDDCEQAVVELSDQMTAFEVPIERVRQRFLSADFERISSDGSYLLQLNELGWEYPFFWFVCSQDGIMTDKFVPGI